jgi:uncharacterized Ntn-hydrolase superfamily protein
MWRAYLGLAVCGSLFLVLGLRPGPSLSAPPGADRGAVNTFSVVAYDPDQKEWGVAVASKYLAVGAVVPWAKAGAGAVATQSYPNTTYGPEGLKLMGEGKSAEEAIKAVTDADKQKDLRQVGMVDAKGNPANFSGDRCNKWFGGKTGKHYTCQGNLLAGEEVIDAMCKAFEEDKGPLAWRLMAALEAGEKAGGDKRGKQAAAILVVRDKGGVDGVSDRLVDLRVDDHDNPVQELTRILAKQIRRP